MTPDNDCLALWNDCRAGAIKYVDSLRCGKPWLMTVSHLAEQPIAIASATAVLLLNFLEALDDISVQTRQDWLEYLQSFQQDDGLFEDKVDMAEETQGYPYWALRGHRSRHIAWAIEALGAKLLKPIRFVQPYTDKQSIERWLDEMWRLHIDKIWSLGNWVMDMGVLLDLQHRHFNDGSARQALHVLLDGLNERQDPVTGFWMGPKVDLRRAMAGAMHFYPLYWACEHPLHHFCAAVEHTLSLQQPDGLFGFESGLGGSQCLDYDAMLILANGHALLPDMRDKIKADCQRVLDAIMVNHNADGSFADTQLCETRYWTTKAAAYRADQGSVWDTYARMMTIAMCIEITTGRCPRPMRSEHHLFEIFHATRILDSAEEGLARRI